MPIQDAYLTYQFLKRLALPYKSWRAYKLGLIDENGNVLKRKKEMNDEERHALGSFDMIVLHLRRLLAKAPGGSSGIARMTAALLLMKEDAVEEGDPPDSMGTANAVHDILERLLVEDSPTNSVGGGAIAGAGVGPDGEPPKGKGLLFNRYKAATRKKVKKNA
jgi:hypothetical protein